MALKLKIPSKDEVEYEINVLPVKNPEFKTTDVIVIFPDNSKFSTTIIDKDREDETQKEIGRAVLNIVINKYKIDRSLIVQKLREQGFQVTRGRPRTSPYEGDKKEEKKEYHRQVVMKYYYANRKSPKKMGRPRKVVSPSCA